MEHPPYPWWDYALDASWVTLFAAAAVVSVIGSRMEQWGWPLLFGGLIATRFLLPHTMGCSVFLFEVPGSLVLLVRSISVLVWHWGRDRGASESPDDHDENEEA